jgi:hypothetical protein
MDVWDCEQMSRNLAEQPRAEWRLALALVILIVGGIAGLIADLVELPFPVFVCAISLFLVAGAFASVLAYQDARDGHVSVLRAIGRALKTALGWFFSLP